MAASATPPPAIITSAASLLSTAWRCPIVLEGVVDLGGYSLSHVYRCRVHGGTDDTPKTVVLKCPSDDAAYDPDTRGLQARQERILPRAYETLGEEVQPELHQVQIEIASPIRRTLVDVRKEVARERRGVIAAAEAVGSRIAAAGTHPFSLPHAQPISTKERYKGIADKYRYMANELVIFGCHVHVGLDDHDALIPVLNRVRLWLAPLLALSANSPFWCGEDTGYASYRTQMWGRWPLAGPPGYFASRAEYDDLVKTLVAVGGIDAAANIYWDARLPEKTRTVEVRVADVCMTVDEAVMIAVLTRALVQTCYNAVLRGEEVAPVRAEVLRHAQWCAARDGLDGNLVDLTAGRLVKAGAMIETLLTYVRPALEEHGDWDEVAALVDMTRQRGSGAARQRAAYTRAGRLEDVGDLIVAETGRETSWRPMHVARHSPWPHRSGDIAESLDPI